MKRAFFPLLPIILIAAFPNLSNAKQVISFQGELDFDKSVYELMATFEDSSSIKANAKIMPDNKIHLALNVEHLKTPYFDFSSELESQLEIHTPGNQDDVFVGRVWSQYSLVDYKPINELSGRYELKDKKLYLDGFTLGNLKFKGVVDLVSPNNVNFDIVLDSVEMEDFLGFWMREKSYESAGLVSGKIEVSGTLNELQLKGKLQSFDGFVKKLEFNSIHLNIGGTYPHMQIAQSKISQSDGLSYSIEGFIDLSDKENFKKQIKALDLSPIVKSEGSEVEWTIKQLKKEDSSGTTEFKYLLRQKDDEVGLSEEEESDMLGVERRMEF